MPRGCVMVMYRHQPFEHPVNILRYLARDPRPGALTFRVLPGGVLRVMIMLGAEDAQYEIALPAMQPGDAVVVRYVWDGARGVLAASVPAVDWHGAVAVDAPVPLTDLVVAQMMVPGLCALDDCVQGVALADHAAPVGPMPGLTAGQYVRTPVGDVRLGDLKPGQLVTGADGQTAQVRWTGAVQVPNMGLFQPVRLRNPFYGAVRDSVMSGEQRLVLRGTEVDYLFDCPEISVRAADLCDGVAAEVMQAETVVTYAHVMIDRPVAFLVDGLWVPGFDPAAILADQVLADWSVLRGFPVALVPRRGVRAQVPLRDFEAQALRQMRAT